MSFSYLYLSTKCRKFPRIFRGKLGFSEKFEVWGKTGERERKEGVLVLMLYRTQDTCKETAEIECQNSREFKLKSESGVKIAGVIRTT